MSTTQTSTLSSTSVQNLKKFIDTHSSHGWQLITNHDDLRFPVIADTHYEFDCPCNPGFHYTVIITENHESPAYHLKP